MILPLALLPRNKDVLYLNNVDFGRGSENLDPDWEEDKWMEKPRFF